MHSRQTTVLFLFLRYTKIVFIMNNRREYIEGVPGPGRNPFRGLINPGINFAFIVSSGFGVTESVFEVYSPTASMAYIYIYIYLSIYLYIYISFYLSIYKYIDIYLSFYLSIYIYIYHTHASPQKELGGASAAWLLIIDAIGPLEVLPLFSRSWIHFISDSHGAWSHV